MILVRYVALAALVVWLGAVQTAMAGLRQPAWIPYACGAFVIAAFLTMKFVGPPPRAFAARLGIVLLMLAAAVYERTAAAPSEALAVEAALGFILLVWYARE